MQVSPRVTDPVADYRGYIESQAFRFSRMDGMQNDFDDFVQEGVMGAMKALEQGIVPQLVIENRMKDWARKRKRQLNHQGGMDDAGELAA